MKQLIFLLLCATILVSCGTTTCGIGESPKKSWDVIQAQSRYGLSFNPIVDVNPDTVVVMPIFDGKTVKQWMMLTMDSVYLFTWVKESKENYGYLTVSADDIAVDLEHVRERETYCHCEEIGFYNPNRYYWNIIPSFIQEYPFR